MATIPVDQNKNSKSGMNDGPHGIRRKRKAGKHLLRSLVEEDGRAAAEYIMNDIVIPSAKSLLHDIMDRGSARLLWGDGGYSNGRYNSYSSNNRPYNDYASRSIRPISDARANQYNRSRRNQTSVFVDDIYLDSLHDLEEFDSRLHYLLDNQGFVRVSDYYKAANLESNYIDARFGWYDLRTMTKIKEGDMWLVSMPIPEEIQEAR